MQLLLLHPAGNTTHIDPVLEDLLPLHVTSISVLASVSGIVASSRMVATRGLEVVLRAMLGASVPGLVSLLVPGSLVMAVVVVARSVIVVAVGFFHCHHVEIQACFVRQIVKNQNFS